ncbi:hypothetical protein ACFL3B_03710 [Gemmatimonadota bacterium]
MRTISRSLVLLLLLPYSVVSAQTQTAIPAGDRVRVTAPVCGLSREVTTLDAVHGNTMVFGTGECLLDFVKRLEVDRGHWPNIREGIIGGGVLLGGLPLAMGLAMMGEDRYEGGIGDVVIVSASMAAIGASFGALVGIARGRRWKWVPRTRFSAAAISRPDGFVLAASVRF